MVTLLELIKDKREILEDLFLCKDTDEYRGLEEVLIGKEKEIVNHPDYLSLYHEYTRLNLLGILKLYGTKLRNTTKRLADWGRKQYEYLNSYLRK